MDDMDAKYKCMVAQMKVSTNNHADDDVDVNDDDLAISRGCDTSPDTLLGILPVSILIPCEKKEDKKTKNNYAPVMTNQLIVADTVRHKRTEEIYKISNKKELNGKFCLISERSAYDVNKVVKLIKKSDAFLVNVIPSASFDVPIILLKDDEMDVLTRYTTDKSVNISITVLDEDREEITRNDESMDNTSLNGRMNRKEETNNKRDISIRNIPHSVAKDTLVKINQESNNKNEEKGYAKTNELENQQDREEIERKVLNSDVTISDIEHMDDQAPERDPQLMDIEAYIFDGNQEDDDLISFTDAQAEDTTGRSRNAAPDYENDSLIKKSSSEHIETNDTDGNESANIEGAKIEENGHGMLHFLGGQVNKAKKYFFPNSVVQKDLQQLLHEEKLNWLSEEDMRFSTYEKALELINRARRQQYYDKLEELSIMRDMMTEYIEKKNFKVDLLFISFALHVLKASVCITHHRRLHFAKMVLGCISSFDEVDYKIKGPRLSDVPLIGGTSHACDAMKEFISTTIKPSAYSFDEEIVGRGATENSILTTFIWIIVYHCSTGLDSWQDLLRPLARPDYFESQSDVLQTFLEVNVVRGIGLSLCGNLKAFNDLCMTFLKDDKTDEVVLPKEICKYLSYVIERESYQMGRDGNKTTDKIPAQIDTLLNILSIVTFDRDDETCRKGIITDFVYTLSFRKLNTFSKIDCLHSRVGLLHKDYDIFHDACIRSICNDIGRTYPVTPLLDVKSLLQFEISDLLYTSEGIEAISAYAESAMTRKGRFQNKLDFLDCLSRFLLKCNPSYIPDNLSNLIKTCMTRSIEKSTPSKVINDSFKMAATRPMMFAFPDAAKPLGSWIVSKIVTKAVVLTFIGDPSKLVSLDMGDPTTSKGSLLFLLTKELKMILLNECIELDKAVELYTVVCLTNGGKRSLSLQSMAEHVLVNSYRKWNAKSITDVLAIEPNCLIKTYGCLADRNKENDAQMLESKNDCINHLKTLVIDWTKKFQSDGMTCVDISFIRDRYQNGIWKFLEKIAGVVLPKPEELNTKIVEFTRLKEALTSQFMVVNDDEEGTSSSLQPLHVILNGYSAVTKTGTHLHRILSDYRLLFDTKSSKSGIDDTITLRTMRQDTEFAASFRQKYNVEICLAEFFLRNNSILFRDAIAFGTWKILSAEELIERIQNSRTKLQNLFKPSLEMNSVLTIAKLTNTSKCNMTEELSVLCRCPYLDTSIEAKNTLSTAAALSGLSQPLLHFVNCCNQFKFGFIDCDPVFTEIVKTSNELSSDDARMWSVTKFLDVAERASLLLGLAFSESSSSAENQRPGHLASKFSTYRQVVDQSTSLLCMQRAFKLYLPVLNYLSDLSRYNSDVWVLAREMQWFGEDGLKRFYKEHENVTNVLLGNIASYEMSVLNSLEPTVRCLSFIGSVQNVTSCQEFVECLQKTFIEVSHNDCDLVDDLRIVQQNVSSVREWFTTGMDEMATILVTFDRIYNTGQYFVTESSDGSSDTGSGRLLIQYQSERFPVDGRQNETASLEGEALSKFVQHLGFIQHESEEVSEKVKKFVDQHQLLTRIAENLLTMSKVSFNQIDLCSFHCKIKDNTLADARRLLEDTDFRLSRCKEWLVEVRSNHKLSLLFWLEELEDIYSCLTMISSPNIRDGNVSPEKRLLRIASRIIPMYDPKEESALEVAATSAISELPASIAGTSQSWVLTVCEFLDSLHLKLGSPRMKNRHEVSNPNTVKTTGSRVIVHTLDCNEAEKNSALLCLLKKIYVGRLPEIFEVLDGSITCSLEKFSTYLDRVLAFPSSTFVLLNTEKLAGELLERLISFLSCPNIKSEGLNLHCIQNTASMLRATPWTECRSWEDGSLSTLPQCSGDNQADGDWFKQKILDNIYIERIQIVSSARSGSGKTRYIREELEKFRSNAADVGAINIHEGTSLSHLVQIISSKFPPSTRQKAVHFSFTHTPTKTGCNSSWLEMINHFFVSFLVLRSVYDPVSTTSFNLGSGRWNIFIELPSQEYHNKNRLSSIGWLYQFLPILSFCGEIVEPPKSFVVDAETRHVCMYLRAYDNKTINRKFRPQHKRVIFVLDESGSMQLGQLDVATDNALKIFDSHIQIDDMIGIITFDHEVRSRIGLQKVTDEGHKRYLRNQMDAVRKGSWGGTSMYAALRDALDAIDRVENDSETWIIALTDGASADSASIIQDRLRCSANNLHIILIGVNLDQRLHEPMRDLCNKYRSSNAITTKGCFIPTASDVAAMNDAFQRVASKIPVSKTFELDGQLSQRNCHYFMKKYIPRFIEDDDMLLKTFWIRYLHRRVKVFDKNKSFNYNVVHKNLGSSIMETMLSEVMQFLREDQNKSWIGKNHHQLIYDFTKKDSPEFRLVCTDPEEMDEGTRAKYESLDLPGFFIPSCNDLKQRSTLDMYLSQALNIPLSKNRDGFMTLPCIEENSFVLTLDFTLKLLCIHERISCRIPCVIEGETGVSKTALTKMYSILMNSSIQARAETSTLNDLKEIEATLIRSGISFEYCSDDDPPEDRLHQVLIDASEKTLEDETDIALQLLRLLRSACESREPWFEEPPTDYTEELCGKTSLVTKFLAWFSSAVVQKMFFEINVHGSLTEHDVLDRFDTIRKTAKKLTDSQGLVVVFFDEVNTSSILGLFKEIIIDHSICGERLEPNIAIVAACNPARTEAVHSGISQRENDLGKDWASGHYQVSNLPGSIAKLKWAYGSLTSEQEKEFIFRRLEMLSKDHFPTYLARSMTELISTSHETIRSFASESMLRRLRSINPTLASEDDARLRARSTVSLRDIQRVFSLFRFFSEDFRITCSDSSSEIQRYRHAMLLSLAVAYYFRLDHDSRSKFIDILKSLQTEQTEVDSLPDVLKAAMDRTISETEIPPGIALTRGLKENVFTTLVCSLARIPLMIVGPPGSSKTLSVNIVSDNANGVESPSPFYRRYARLSTFHYQCSKASTSNEVASVFKKAIQKQKRVDASKHKCLVFLDEAGLPEEEKESLKVLHYFLEGHMSTNAEVSFVAITNHILDAAKSNRCVMLLRQEPDKEELLDIAQGVLYDAKVDGSYNLRQIQCDNVSFHPDEFAFDLCRSYRYLLYHKREFRWFELFFGLRDFLFFLKAIRCVSVREVLIMRMSMPDIVRAFERNFSGIDPERMKELVVCFFCPMVASKEAGIEYCINLIGAPMDVVRDAITAETKFTNHRQQQNKPRYKLIIDESEDDSIMRLLSTNGVLNLTKQSLFKLSGMSDNADLEKSRLVSGVKYCAMQGNTAILSHTDAVNESFYDLFNQNFRSLRSRTGDVSLYANIAVGGTSRRSLVSQTFQCIVQVRKSELEDVPAPFLNRFEKFRLSVSDFLEFRWRDLGGMKKIFQDSRARVNKIRLLLGDQGFFGFVEGQTIDSIFLDMLPHLRRGSTDAARHSAILNSNSNCLDAGQMSFPRLVAHFLGIYTSLTLLDNDITPVIETAMTYLPVEERKLIQKLMERGNEVPTARLQKVFDTIISEEKLSKLARVIEQVIQMVLTRLASFRLFLLATPEAVFANRRSLPCDIIEEYFRQEHFSLKSLLLSLDKESTLNMVYTRTDELVHSLPSLPADNNTALDLEGGNFTVITDLVHNDIDKVAIEHLFRLKAEASIRSVVDSWIARDNKELLLLIADMSESNAISRVNFVRALVDQRVSGQVKKKFVLLLHYAPSISQRNSCYPALFLGGWRHVFLDGIGNAGEAVVPHKWIKSACQQPALLSSSVMGDDIKAMMSAYMPRVLTYVACQQIFYPGQVTHNVDLCISGRFSEQCDALLSLMNQKLGESSVGDILSEKFLETWTGDILFKTLRRSSDALMQGTTQLSMSMSLRSTFQESLRAFLVFMIAEMNQWRNLDILSNTNRSPAIDDLFCFITMTLPIPSLEKLMLRGNSKSKLKLFPTRASKRGPISIRFPFFQFVSSFLDGVVQTAEETFVDQTPLEDSMVLDIDTTECILRHATEVLEGRNHSNENSAVTSSRRKLVAEIMARVTRDKPNNIDSLFQRYLFQYLTWKVGWEPTPTVVDWVLDKITLEHEGNLVMIHIIVRRHEVELMHLASWMECQSDMETMQLSQRVCDISRHGESSLFSGRKLLQTTISHFEKSLGNCRSSDWLSSFSLFLRRVEAILGGEGVHEIQHILRIQLRALCFFHILASCDVPDEVMERARNRWYMIEINRLKFGDEHSTSLKCFVEVLGDSRLEAEKVWYSESVEKMLRHFFSPLWLRIVDYNYIQDLKFLVSFIADGNMINQHRLAVVLLKTACSTTQKSKDNRQEKISIGLNATCLQIVTSRIECEGLSSFSADDQRSSLPHFVPYWLRDMEPMSVHSKDTNMTNDSDVFFEDYKHCFRCPLSNVVFDLVLTQVLEEAEGMSSEQILLALTREIEIESSLKRSEQIRFSFSGSPTIKDCVSLVGSAISSMIADARLISFVAKVAYELATKSRATALCGQHSYLGYRILESTMGLRGYLWQEFFFKTIIRVRGKGNVLVLLGEGGMLHRLSWCQQWICGTGSEGSLRNAEDELAETVAEEERKAKELRRCPHCRGLFMVLARNCGQFVCGQDRYIRVGMNGPYGCGKSFAVDASHPYVTDEARLGDLRKKVAEELRQLEVFIQASARFDKMEALNVPFLLLRIHKVGYDESFVPTCIVSDILDESPYNKHSSLFGKMKMAHKERGNCFQYSLLPDLIEFYMWIHSTFRFLVTRQQALDMTLDEMINHDILLQRLDEVTTNHFLRLWKRVSKGLDDLLVASNHKVNWECDEVNIPFRRVEDASLMMFLSEGRHPTDGHDYLFLVINDIIEKFNSFTQRMNNFERVTFNNLSGNTAAREISPRFLLRGSGGAVAISRYTQDSSWMSLSSLIESFFNRNLSDCTEDKLMSSLEKELTLLYGFQPTILSPTGFLREQFRFRDEPVTRVSDSHPEQVVLVGSNGDFFVHTQDRQLYETTKQSLQKYGRSEGLNPIRHAVLLNFHEADYNMLRNLLEGIQMAVTVISPNDFYNKTFGEALEASMMIDEYENGYESFKKYVLCRYGFPNKLRNPQVQLIWSLKSDELIEITNFFGYQLASEAYLFSNLPLIMNDPMPELGIHQLKNRFKGLLKDEESIKSAVGFLEEFQTDCLMFYEKEIRNKAVVSNQPLKRFLESNNFCDDTSFPFLKVIPDNILLRNYISLRQFLHQMKLETILQGVRDGSGDSTMDYSEDVPGLENTVNKVTKNECWLWTEPNEVLQPVSMKNDVKVDFRVRRLEQLWIEILSLKRREKFVVGKY